MRERQEIIKLYVRVCRDSGFSFAADRAAQFTAQMLGWGPNAALRVWTDSGLTLDDMEALANGTHPALRLKQYGGTE